MTLTRKSSMSRHKAELKSGEKKLRQKCSVKGCKEPAATFTALKGWCSPEHGAIVALGMLVKKKAAVAKETRKQHKERQDAIKTRSDWLRDTQAVFNQYRREWCKQNGFNTCPCCGLALDWTQNAVDAGHYRSVGSAPHMRFTENNVWAQRKQCNRYGAGRAVDYRLGLIARIGLEAVEALESDNTARKWTISEMKVLKAEYQAKLRELKAREA